MQVWKIEVLLKENLSNEDEVISSLCKRMMEKFDKYWTQYSMVLAFGAILDPRIKLSMLEFFYTKEIMAYENQTITSAGKSQLDLYLEESKLEFAYYQDLNVLEHWKNQNHRYPTLALMACDVLAIPITTVVSESTFSIGARVLTKYRSHTLHEKVQAIICTRNWLHGYAIDNDNEDNASIKTTLSKKGSNGLEDIDAEKGDDGESEEFDN
ncbi:hypothetical protein ZIOFF_056560 [Zingiber officinale]|uniref:Zinc finger BED domain-containing protein DAYSLEEPER-like n=1 Tax=Zingiber officinale TaxID=94328 RepID=A0A8J5FJ27_ZINOF|nr:hypothetical protein ZIOFF_056560 [Zingiber officinale]